MFSGSLVALVTPMHPDGAVDYDAWGRLLEFHVAEGSAGVVVGGTTGESATLLDAELHELTRRAVQQVHGRLRVIAGAGSSSTAATIARVRMLCELPVDALLIVTPAYNRPTQEGLFRHFSAAAQAAAGVPLVLYNVPARTAVDLLPATVARLAEQPGIAALKEAVPDLARLRELAARCGPNFTLLSGDDASSRAALGAGARGVISVTANVAPRRMSEMVSAACAGDAQAAQRADTPLQELHQALFIEANPIPVKWLLARMGLIGAGIRLPLTPLGAEHQPRVQAGARAAGLSV